MKKKRGGKEKFAPPNGRLPLVCDPRTAPDAEFFRSRVKVDLSVEQKRVKCVQLYS